MINRKKCIDKMADRIPLIVNPGASQIQELQNSDDLVLSGQLKMTGIANAGDSDIGLSGGSDAKAVIGITSTSSNLSQLSIDCRNNADNASLNVADFKVGTSDKIELVVKGDVTATNFIKTDGTPIATNAPTFKALLNADQQITSTPTNTTPNSQKIEFGTEEFDSDGCFNNTNSNATLNGITVPSYSFAPNVAGFYFVSASASPRHTSSSGLITFSHIKIFKNNVLIASCVSDIHTNSEDNENTQTASTIIQMNGTSDTIHVETAVETDGGENASQLKIIKNDVTNYFFAYKLIT